MYIDRHEEHNTLNDTRIMLIRMGYNIKAKPLYSLDARISKHIDRTTMSKTVDDYFKFAATI